MSEMAHPIAPARSPKPGNTSDPRLIPLARADRSHTTGIVTSKKWVLPPRPKPGRKPAPKEDAKKYTEVKENVFQSTASSTDFELREGLEKKTNSGSRNLTGHFRTDRASRSESLDNLQDYSNSTHAARDVKQNDSSTSFGSNEVQILNQPDAAPLEASSDCGFCDREGGCVCEDLGLKPGHEHSHHNSHHNHNNDIRQEIDINHIDSHTHHDNNNRSYRNSTSQTNNGVRLPVEALSQFDNFSPVKAVPLKRTPKNSDAPSNVKKFKKLMKEPEASNHRSIPSRVSSEVEIIDFSNPTMATEHHIPLSTAKSPFEVGLNTPKFDAIEEGESKTSAHANPCGFCSDDTPCLCADEREGQIDEKERQIDDSVSEESRLTEKIETDTTTPADTTPTPSQSMPSATPGSCPQCLADPMSTLFCTSLSNISSDKSLRIPSDQMGITVSCSQAYQVLSRHKRFPNYDLGLLISDLVCQDGKVGIQSISQVLRKLDGN